MWLMLRNFRRDLAPGFIQIYASHGVKDVTC